MNYIKLFFNNIINTLFRVDTHILGLYRILFGIVLFFDIQSRLPIVHLFYSNKSIFPTSYILSSPYKVMPFTLMPAFNQPWEIYAFMYIGMIACVLFILGYRTKLTQIIASIVVLSIHNKVSTLENGGDMVVNNFIIWSLFLPLGISYSYDSLKKSLKNSIENTPADLNSYKKENQKIISIGFFACIVQIAMIYFFNFKTKTGGTWTNLTSLHYFFELDSFLTPIGYWAKDNLSFKMKELLTQATLIIEMCVPFLIFIPIFTRYIRRICFIVLLGFHLNIALFMDIGTFSWIMIAVDALLLSINDMEILKSVFKKIHGKSVTLIYDSDCGFCHQIVRIIRRLDVFDKITIYGNEWLNNIDDNFEETRKESILLFKNHNEQKIYSHHYAFFHLISRLPFGFLISWIFLVPGISHLVNFTYKLIADNRTTISGFFGLNACGIPQNKSNEAVVDKSGFPIFRYSRLVIINIVIIGLLIANIQKSLIVNEPFKSDYDFRETITGRKVLRYLRMKQNWKMFAPGVLKKDVILVTDLTTVKGYRIDPFTGETPLDLENLDFVNSDINYGQFVRKFMKRSVENKNSKLIDQLDNWLQNTKLDINGKRHPKARRYKVWKLTQYSSKPSDPPKEIRKELITEFPKKDEGKKPVNQRNKYKKRNSKTGKKIKGSVRPKRANK